MAASCNGPKMCNAVQEIQSGSRSRKRKAPTLKEDDWWPVKMLVTELYEDGLSLDAVMSAMREEYGFEAT